jgi:hypothetical protein
MLQQSDRLSQHAIPRLQEVVHVAQLPLIRAPADHQLLQKLAIRRVPRSQKLASWLTSAFWGSREPQKSQLLEFGEPQDVHFFEKVHILRSARTAECILSQKVCILRFARIAESRNFAILRFAELRNLHFFQKKCKFRNSGNTELRNFAVLHFAELRNMYFFSKKIQVSEFWKHRTPNPGHPNSRQPPTPQIPDHKPRPGHPIRGDDPNFPKSESSECLIGPRPPINPADRVRDRARMSNFCEVCHPD